MPCVSAPLGGTIEPSAELEIDAQKRGETERNRGIGHLEQEGKLSKWTLTSVQDITGKEKNKLIKGEQSLKRKATRIITEKNRIPQKRRNGMGERRQNL